MVNFTLIIPDSPFLIAPKTFPSLGSLYLAAVLKEAGHNVKLVDLTGGKKLPKVEEDSIVGISATTPQINQATSILREVKRRNPNQWVVCGGPHPSCAPESCFKMGFDQVCVGEGERAIIKIAEGCRDQIVKEPFIEDLDTIPFPDRSCEGFNFNEYHHYLDGKRSTNIMGSRGCPFLCVFCCKMPWGQTVRFRSPENVLSEIKFLNEVYGIEGIVFFDDEMNVNTKRLAKISDLLAPTGIVWRCQLRAKPLNLALLRKMGRSGCVEIQIGGESGSDEVLKTIRKGTTVKDNLRAVKLIEKAGIQLKLLMMVGNPGESRKTVEETRQFLRKAKKIHPKLETSLMLYTPYPHSDIWDHTEDYDIQFDKEEMDFSKAIYKQPDPLNPEGWVSLVRTSHLSGEELTKLHNEICEEFSEWGLKLAKKT